MISKFLVLFTLIFCELSFSILQFPECIHFDVEPHLYEGWKNGNDIEELSIAMLDLFSETKRKIEKNAKGKLCVSAAITVWWNWPAYEVEYNGERKALGYHCLDILDDAVFMDYTNNPDLAINYISQEIAYAEANTNTTADIYIGFETLCQGVPNMEDTFCQKTNQELETALEKVYNNFFPNRENNNFKGMVVHYLQSWLDRNPSPSIEIVDRNVWVWENYLFEENHENHDTYYQFIEDHKINKLYASSVAYLPNEKEKIIHVLNESCKRGASIDIMIGDNQKYLTTEKEVVSNLVDDAIELFNSLEYEENTFCKRNDGQIITSYGMKPIYKIFVFVFVIVLLF